MGENHTIFISHSRTLSSEMISRFKFLYVIHTLLSKFHLRSVEIILYNNEEIFIVWHHHELTLLCSDPHEGDVIAGVHLLEHGGGLGHEAAQDAAVLTCRARVQCRLDAGPLLIIIVQK